MKYLTALLVLMVAFTCSGQLLAANEDSGARIDYLLHFIGESECVFIRNGKEHSARDARQHIERKYDYLKSRIDSVDEFITQAASKSSFSGRPYTVRCGDAVLTSEQWLRQALLDFQSTGSH